MPNPNHLRHEGLEVDLARVLGVEARVRDSVHRTGSLKDLLEQSLPLALGVRSHVVEKYVLKG